LIGNKIEEHKEKNSKPLAVFSFGYFSFLKEK